MVRSNEKTPESLYQANAFCLQKLESAVNLLSTLCDHLEHCEPNNVNNINLAGKELRQIAVELARQNNVSLRDVYAQRLSKMETDSVLRLTSTCSPSEMIARAQTWHDLQVGQILHDDQFHPDVFGLSKYNQLRHYALHVSKLPDHLSKAIAGNSMEVFCQERLADIVAFGVKLATLRNEALPKISFVD